MIDLDVAVINALQLFAKKKVPRLSVAFKRPLVVGSGNALATGRILFPDADFADENTYKSKSGDGAIIVSASGAKHAPVIAQDLKMKKVLVTCNPDAPAKKFCDKVFLFPSVSEPYSFNVSTYLGMILGKTKESPKKVLDQIKKLKLPSFKRFNAYTLIVPPEFKHMCCMFRTKFEELFGPMINGRVFTSEEVKHAKTIVPSHKELFISFGYNNRDWGRHRLHVPLPKKFDFGMLMAVGYFVIGKIQKSNTPWFKNNIANYCKKISRVFGHKIEPVVKND